MLTPLRPASILILPIAIVERESCGTRTGTRQKVNSRSYNIVHSKLPSLSDGTILALQDLDFINYPFLPISFTD